MNLTKTEIDQAIKFLSDLYCRLDEEMKFQELLIPPLAKKTIENGFESIPGIVDFLTLLKTRL